MVRHETRKFSCHLKCVVWFRNTAIRASAVAFWSKWSYCSVSCCWILYVVIDQHQEGTGPLCHPFTNSSTKRKCQAGIKLASRWQLAHSSASIASASWQFRSACLWQCNLQLFSLPQACSCETAAAQESTGATGRKLAVCCLTAQCAWPQESASPNVEVLTLTLPSFYEL